MKRTFFTTSFSSTYICVLLLGCFFAFFTACDPDSGSSTNNNPSTPKTNGSGAGSTAAKKDVTVPKFDGASAYNYIKKQVDFGPRMPGTDAHKACASWLESELKKYAGEVIVQKGTVKAYTGQDLPMYNVIGSFNPENKERIMFCAHWDTRHIAEQDPDATKQKEPILGANDGGSGVGVLLEIARVLKANPIDLGVDIILFDVEDYGNPEVTDSYCLGSQYWSRTPHKPGYTAKYGILLDMVGASDALFLKERYSLAYAPQVVKKVWETANKLGYGTYFSNDYTASRITDDHLYVNKIAKIPTIDIIHYSNDATATGFGEFWHTHDDDMDIISKSTLKVVGRTLLTVIYNEDAGK